MLNCPKCKSIDTQKDGRYFRANDSRWVQRYRCKNCFKKFSRATFELEYRHKKRRINHQVFKLYCSGVSCNRMAWLLGVHRLTIKRKILYLAKKSLIGHRNLLKELNVAHVQIDDLITIEHTKLKPLTVTTAYSVDKKLMLSCKVSQIPAFGHLAKISRAKYGYRKSFHRHGLKKVFDEINPIVKPNSLFESDMHKFYPEFIQKYFPDADHHTFKSERGCVSGQGELKKKKFDPIFHINQNYATLRGDINRLFRRTWCTTKDPQMLQCHLDIYKYFYNLKKLNMI